MTRVRVVLMWLMAIWQMVMGAVLVVLFIGLGVKLTLDSGITIDYFKMGEATGKALVPLAIVELFLRWISKGLARPPLHPYLIRGMQGSLLISLAIVAVGQFAGGNPRGVEQWWPVILPNLFWLELLGRLLGWTRSQDRWGEPTTEAEAKPTTAVTSPPKSSHGFSGATTSLVLSFLLLLVGGGLFRASHLAVGEKQGYLIGAFVAFAGAILLAFVGVAGRASRLGQNLLAAVIVTALGTVGGQYGIQRMTPPSIRPFTGTEIKDYVDRCDKATDAKDIKFLKETLSDDYLLIANVTTPEGKTSQKLMNAQRLKSHLGDFAKMQLYHFERSNLQVAVRSAGEEGESRARYVDEVPIYKGGAKNLNDFDQVSHTETEDRTIYARENGNLREIRCYKNTKESILARQQSFWKNK